MKRYVFSGRKSKCGQYEEADEYDDNSPYSLVFIFAILWVVFSVIYFFIRSAL